MSHKPPGCPCENQKGAPLLKLGAYARAMLGSEMQERETLSPPTFKGCRPEEIVLHALELLPLPLQLPLNGVRNSIHKMEA